MTPAPFVIERTYDAPAKSVWEALTDVKKMRQWYFQVSDFKPEPGFEFTFTGEGPKGEEYVHLCRVTAVKLFEKIAYTWKYKGFPGESEVTFELFEEGGKTRLKLTHAGLETFPLNNPDFAKTNFKQGWTEILGSMLPKYLASPAGKE